MMLPEEQGSKFVKTKVSKTSPENLKEGKDIKNCNRQFRKGERLGGREADG